jgi:hypothetical protein
MTLIDFGDIKIRFDPKEVRINIDGDLIDIGARREEQLEEKYLPDGKGGYTLAIKTKSNQK